MKDLQPIQAIAREILALSAELLRLIDCDENERRLMIENAKKTPTGMCYISLA